MFSTKSDDERVALITRLRDEGQLNHWSLADRLEVSRIQTVFNATGGLDDGDRLQLRLLLVRAMWSGDRPCLA